MTKKKHIQDLFFHFFFQLFCAQCATYSGLDNQWQYWGGGEQRKGGIGGGRRSTEGRYCGGGGEQRRGGIRRTTVFVNLDIPRIKLVFESFVFTI